VAMRTSISDADRAFERDHRWTILVIVSVAQLMVVLDATIVNIALPAAQRDLGFPNHDRQWVVTAYALAFGSLLLLGGKITDLFGRKWTFIVGLIGFAVASAVGGAANSFSILVIARAFQGAFGALLAPAALATLTNTFQDPVDRGKAFAVFGAVAGGGGAVGLLLGGFLTEYLSWRWCLYVNLVFAALAAVGAIIFLRNERPVVRPKVDLLGTATAGVGLFLVVYGFSHAATDGWTNAQTLASLIAAFVLLVAFVQVEKRVAHPLLPLRVVLDRTRGGSYLAVGLAAIALFGVFLFLTFYLQRNKGFSPILTGVAILPIVAGVLLGSTLSNIKLMPIVGVRVLITVGMLLAAASMLYLSRITQDSGYWTHVFPVLPFFGFGFGLIFAPAFNSATDRVAQDDAGVASAMVNTMQQVGGSIGTALLSTIAVSATTSYLGSHPGANPAAEAAVHGYTVAFLVSAGIFLVGAIAVFLIIEPHRRPTEPSPPQGANA
jgi:EmrB/QacA subfamily drug resistance transporter